MPFRFDIPKSLFLTALLLSAGCTSPLAKVNSDLNQIRRDLQDLRALQAEQTTVISTVREDLRSVHGRVEQLEHEQGQLHNLRDDVSTIKQRVPPPSIVPVEQLEEDEMAAERVSGEVGEAYREGLTKVRAGNYARALELFRDALGLAPKRDVMPNILFWIGVVNDGLGQPRDALRSYHECASEFPKHPRASLALVRQAASFLRLGDTASAKLTYKKIISQYPRSSEASVAKAKLSDL
jgi:TolA-binding protein